MTRLTFCQKNAMVVASRDKHERPGLQTIFDGIEANNVDAVLTVSMSRFSRKPKLAHEALDKIKECGVEIICMDGSENAPFEDLEAMSPEEIDEEFEDEVLGEPESSMLSLSEL